LANVPPAGAVAVIVTVETPPFSETLVGDAAMVIVGLSSSLMVTVADAGLPTLHVVDVVHVFTVTVAVALPSPESVFGVAVTVHVALV
jgi:hypothetical protein